MKGRYRAAFIIPVGAEKVLGEDGWEFKLSSPISLEVSEYLIKSLGLRLLESYLGLDDYINKKIKMSVIHDDIGCIESIYFQLYDDALTILCEVCESSEMPTGVELFIPDINPNAINLVYK